MTITINHSTPADGTFSAAGAIAWDANHTFTGVLDIANGGTGSTTANTAINALLPNQTGNSGKVLSTNGTDTSWIVSGTGSGDVTGPASSTDNAITRFNGTTGKVVQNSSVIIDNSNNVSGVATLNAATLIIADNTTLGSSNTDTVAVNGRITTDLEPNTTGSHDIGTSGRNWRDAFFSRNVQVGTITSGVWNGSTIGVAYGGTGITSFGTGVATFLGTPSSANLAAAVTDETGTGALVFGTSPTISGVVLNDGYTEEVFALTGTTPAISPTNGSIQTWTLSGNSTPTAGTWAAGQSITLMIDDGSAFTITWSSLAVTWKTDAGVAPTLNTTGFTAITLWKVGSVIYGARVGNA
jgi:hypothetical protein